MRTINELVIHCAATRPEWMINNSLEDQIRVIDRWHRGRRPPFRKFGYHGFMNRHGERTMDLGTSWGPRARREIGAHVKGNNRHSLGICIAGGHGGATTDQFLDNFTPAQNASLQDWIIEILDDEPTITRLSGHNEYAANACPCFDVMEWAQRWMVRRRPDLWMRIARRDKDDGEALARPVLRRNDHDAHVARVAALLGLPKTDWFTAELEDAVKAFQRRNGLTIDGIVGRNTWAALDALGAPAPQPAAGFLSRLFRGF